MSSSPFKALSLVLLCLVLASTAPAVAQTTQPATQPAEATTRPAGVADRPATTLEQEVLGYRTGSKANSTLKFKALPPLPKEVSGAFMGTLDNVLIVAGGAADVPETGSLSDSRFVDTIYFLPLSAVEEEEEDEEEEAEEGEEGQEGEEPATQPAEGDDEDDEDEIRWRKASVRLPAPTAWGAAAISEEGMLCLGGWTPEGITNRTFRIVWKKGGEIADVAELIGEDGRLVRVRDGKVVELSPEQIEQLRSDDPGDEDLGRAEAVPEGTHLWLDENVPVVRRDGGYFEAESGEPSEFTEGYFVQLADGRLLQLKDDKLIPGHIEVKEGQFWSEEDEVWKGIAPLPEPVALAGAKILKDDYESTYSLYLAGGCTPRGGTPVRATTPPDERPGMPVEDNEPESAATQPVVVHQPAEGVAYSDKLYQHRIPKKLQATGVISWVQLKAREIRGDINTDQPVWAETHRQAPGDGTVDPLGRGVVVPALAITYDEKAYKNGLSIFGGFTPPENGEGLVPRHSVWRFVPGSKSRDGWRGTRDTPPELASYSASPVGPSHLLVLAEKKVTEPRTLNRIASLRGADSFMLYHTITQMWVDMTQEAPPPGGVLFNKGEDFAYIGPGRAYAVLLGDEAKDEAPETTAGSAAAMTGKLEYVEKHFSIVDFVVIGVYIAALIGIGSYYTRKERDTDDYFLGGRKIPWWAAGISIYATGISAISFMAIPAKTYALDWSYICLGLFPPVMVFIAAYTFVPLLRGLEITTMMEYMEMRFGKSVRTLNTLIMVAIQIGGRMSVTLLLPSIALTAVTGWNIYWCVAIMGVLGTIYTVMGGISAVIWTDVAQVFVIFGGAVLSFIIICANVDGGLGGVVEVGMNFDKFRSFDFAWDFTVPTFWVFTVWAMADLFGKLGQEGMQRAFSTKDVSSARKSMITMALVSLPGTLLFYGLGAALFAYYHQAPQELNPNLQTDATFPLFIAQKLPVGVAGLVIAGLFAAAMSTIDSGMNSVATVLTRDFYAVFRKDTRERERLNVARVITVVAGALATGLAMYMASLGLRSLWDTFSEIMGLIGGGFGGVIVLALLTKRANTAGALIGTIIGTLAMIGIKANVFGYRVSFFMFGSLAMITCITTGYLFSLIIPSKPKDLTGLTLWTIRKKPGGGNIYGPQQ